MKTRLDVACVESGLFESREKALRAIMAGLVTVSPIKGKVLPAIAETSSVTALMKFILYSLSFVRFGQFVFVIPYLPNKTRRPHPTLSLIRRGGGEFDIRH